LPQRAGLRRERAIDILPAGPPLGTVANREAQMTGIIETLETQHGLLRKLAAEIDRALAEGRMDQVAAQVLKMRTALEAHVALENADFYPAMVGMAERQGQPQMLQIVKLFDQNMRVIAEGLTRFFNRFAGKPFERASFEPEWKALAKVLAQRIEDEESTLHPIHRRLEQAPAQAKPQTAI
jgi:hypothetical protein